jgi:hypothetical protein
MTSGSALRRAPSCSQRTSTGGFTGPLLTIIEAVPVTGGLQSTKMWWPKQRIPSRVVFTLPWAPQQPLKKADLVVPAV